MPTKQELDELADKCVWTITTYDDVDGYKVTGPNGNSIFLPAAGLRYESSLNYVGEYGCYWSTTPYEGDSQFAYYLNFNSGSYDVGWFYRYYGRSVRPVSDK